MNKKKLMPVFVGIVFILIILIACGVVACVEKRTPSLERVDLSEYFKIEKEDEIALMVQDQLLEDKAVFINEVPYLRYETVHQYLNERIYWDTNENILLYALPTELVKAEVGSADYYKGKNKETLEAPIVKTEGNVTYVSLEFVQLFTNMEYELLEEPSRLIIAAGTRTMEGAVVKNVKSEKKAEKYNVIRTEEDIKSPILCNLENEELVEVLAQGEKWSKVRSNQGFIGYILNSQLGELNKVEISREYEEPEYTNISKDYTINMAWHQVTNQSANNTLLKTVADTKGLTTVSPTWFALIDNEGNISSIASASYVNYAHQLGLEVWGLIADFNNDGIKIDVNSVLSYTSKRERIINQLIGAAIENNLDGINVDFELISKEGADHFLQFLRELSIKCRNNGIVLSIDNYVPTEFSMYYNREEEGKIADYVIMMGYDEHYKGSTEAGSVASLDFVENGIQKTLEEVPAEKVILAMPFYTRLWSETPKTEEEIAQSSDTEEFVPYNLGSTVYSLEKAKDFMVGKGVELTWDETEGQYYGEYMEGNVTYKMWVEDETSIEEKLKVMKNYKLAGVSSWKLGLEKSSIWDVIIKYVN